MRREGLGLLDLVGFERTRLGRDALFGFVLVPVSLVFIFAGVYAAGWLVYGTLEPPYLYEALPLPAALYGVLVWPFLWGLTEQMTYNGYLAPRFQVLCRSTVLAVAIVAFAWSFQHDEAARAETARLETERQEAARLEAERQEAARQLADKQEAARAEAAREVERLEAARQVAAQQESQRQEAAREAGRQEAARQAAAQQEAQRQEAAQQEAARQQEAQRQAAAQQEADRAEAARQQEAKREERLRAIGRQLNEEAAQREAASNAARASSTLPLSLSTARRIKLWGRYHVNVELVRYAEAWARKIQFNTPVETVREIAKRPHTAPMLVGLLFLNPLAGLLTGGALGAGAGALSGKLADYGINDDFIRSLGQTIQPGTSALFVLVRRASPDKILPELQQFKGTVLKTSLSNEQEERLRKALHGVQQETRA